MENAEIIPPKMAKTFDLNAQQVPNLCLNFNNFFFRVFFNIFPYLFLAVNSIFHGIGIIFFTYIIMQFFLLFSCSLLQGDLLYATLDFLCFSITVSIIFLH